MKKNLILAMLLAMVFESCAISVSSETKEAIVPSKNYITKKVKVDDFNAISTSTSIDVVYTQTTGDTEVEIYEPKSLDKFIKV